MPRTMLCILNLACPCTRIARAKSPELRNGRVRSMEGGGTLFPSGGGLLPWPWRHPPVTSWINIRAGACASGAHAYTHLGLRVCATYACPRCAHTHGCDRRSSHRETRWMSRISDAQPVTYDPRFFSIEGLLKARPRRSVLVVVE